MIKSNSAGGHRDLGLIERRAFIKLPIEERRRQMAEQAAKMAEHYEQQTAAREREEWQGGDCWPLSL
jgi:hypothetical protein